MSLQIASTCQTFKVEIKPPALWMCSVCWSSRNLEAPGPSHTWLSPEGIVAARNKTSKICAVVFASKIVARRRPSVLRGSRDSNSSRETATSKISTNGIRSCQELRKVSKRRSLGRTCCSLQNFDQFSKEPGLQRFTPLEK